jgi:hypothetical protein
MRCDLRHQAPEQTTNGVVAVFALFITVVVAGLIVWAAVAMAGRADPDNYRACPEHPAEGCRP